MNTKAEEVRSEVSNRYSEAVARPPKTQRGCCGGQPAPVRKGSFVDLAGYSGDEVAALPESAVIDSFGCGNPVAFSALKPGHVVLDLGSGAGIDLLLAAKKVGPSGRVIGVDMTDEMIARANANIRAENLTNVEVRKGIIEDLPVERLVDWVISNCVINLSRRSLRSSARLLACSNRVGKCWSPISWPKTCPRRLSPTRPSMHPALRAQSVRNSIWMGCGQWA